MRRRIALVGYVLVMLLSVLIGSASAAGHPISGANVQLIDAVTYNGQAITPKITAEFCGTTLVEGADYSLSYSDNLLPGIATVTLTGKGNFTGTKDVHFLIQRADISDAVVTGIQDVDPTGERILQDITVTLNGIVLEKDVDWTVHYYQNVRPGIAKMLIMGIGNYTGVIEETFTINYMGEAKEQSVNERSRNLSVNLEVGQPLELTVSSLGSDWSFVKHTVSDGRSSTDKDYSLTFTKSGTYTVISSFSYYSIGYEYVNGVFRKVVKTDSASCALTVVVEDMGDNVEAVEFLDYKEDGTKAVNLLLQVTGDNAADPELSWSSSDTSVARVDSYGRVTVKKAGTALITAQTADGTYMEVDLALDPLNIASKGKVLGLWEDTDGSYSIHVAYDREVLEEDVDYVINSITESNGAVAVVLEGKGVFGGTLTAVLPAPDFESVRYSIQAIQSNGGTITVSPTRAAFGETVTITAVPDNGYQLYHVYLDGEEFAGSSFTVYGDHSVRAEFIPAAQGDVWDGSAMTEFTSGTGTEADPYQIYTAANLAYMAERVNAGDTDYVSAYYILMNDIDLAGYEWTSIGVGVAQTSYLKATSTNAFKGSFDGNGKTIYGLTQTAKMQKSYAGLFGCVYGAEVKDLTIKNALIDINYSAYGYSFGGVLSGGAHNATITNCIVDGGQVLGAGDYSQVGGLVGLVSADSNTAGMIVGCASSAEIGGKTACAGGLIGLINYSTVRNCMVVGEVNLTVGANVGGFAGLLNVGSIQYCQTAADVAIGNISGGFVGYIVDGTIKDSYCTGDVTASSYAGGFAGYIGGGTLSTCWSGSSVSGAKQGTYVGGFAGYCNKANAVRYAFFAGGVESENTYTGAMFGSYSSSMAYPDSSTYRAVLSGGKVTLSKLCGNSSTLKPTGISEEELRTESFYKNTMYFNLTSVWALDGDMLYLRNPNLAMQSVEIIKGGEQIFCTLNQPAEIDGLTLKVTCSNGLVYYTDSGYTVSGDTSSPGETQLVVSVQGVGTTCSAVVLGDYFARIDSITEDLAQITIQTKESGLLIVAVYEQNGKMVGCAFKDVSAGMTQVNVFMGMDELPDGYKTQLFLVQNDSYVPLAQL